MSILEVVVPNEIVSVLNTAVPSPVFYPDIQTAAGLMSHSVDRIDTLLEDWYPDVGCRFAQNTRGTYLISRLVPCSRCLLGLETVLSRDDDWMIVDLEPDQLTISAVFRPVSVNPVQSALQSLNHGDSHGDDGDDVEEDGSAFSRSLSSSVVLDFTSSLFYCKLLSVAFIYVARGCMVSNYMIIGQHYSAVKCAHRC